MIFDLTKSYVPQPYAESRDYRVFLRELSTLVTVLKYNIDHFPDLYDASECPDHLLPLLATMVGYKYRPNLSVENNRKIIQYYPYLIRNRGSELGMKLAVVLSINTGVNTENTTYTMDQVIVESDPDAGTITIYYPRIDVSDWSLLEVVRPVGMSLTLIPEESASSSEAMIIQTKLSHSSQPKSESKSTVSADDYSPEDLPDIGRQVSYDRVEGDQ